MRPDARGDPGGRAGIRRRRASRLQSLGVPIPAAATALVPRPPMRLTPIAALAALLFASTATAQLTNVPWFAGAEMEEFDNSLPGGRILNNTATITPSPGGQMLQTQAWLLYVGYTVSTQSNAFLGSSVGHMIVTFDDPVQRFGAWFATVGYLPGGYALLYDDGGNLLANEPLAAPRGGPWTWTGWDVGLGGTKIQRIELFANDPYNNGALLCMDDAECDVWLGMTDTRATGCGGLNFAVGGLPVLGDTITFSTPGATNLTAIAIGAPISVPLPQCPGCTVGVDLAFGIVGSPWIVDIPNSTSLLDYTMATQALGLGGNCLGFLVLSDTIDVRIGR